MKKFKKIASIMMAAIMILALNIPAFAAGETYSIKITKTNNKHTYTAYQIFAGDVTIKEDGGKTLSNIKWGKSVPEAGQQTLQNKYKVDSAEKVAAALTSDNVKEFTKAAIATGLTGGKTGTLAGDAYTISGLEAGYYIVVDSANGEAKPEAYSDYIVQIVGNVEVAPKASVPEVEKKVIGDNDAAIGDTIKFELKATLGTDLTGYKTYKLVFKDKLSTGLTYTNNVEVKIGGTVLEKQYYTVNESNGNLTVTIPDVLAHGAKAGSVITVTYTAKLNENAVVGAPGNKNEVVVEYSNDPNSDGTGTTPKKEVEVYTYELVINKVDGEKHPLKGAGFTLFKKVNSDYVQVGEEIKGTDLTTFKWTGLDAGEYKLVETTTPEGYNTIDPIFFTITSGSGNGTPGYTSDNIKFTPTDGHLTADVVNKAGSTLPETGGMGTTVIYLLGGVLVLGAAVLLITKKRMDSNS